MSGSSAARLISRDVGRFVPRDTLAALLRVCSAIDTARAPMSGPPPIDENWWASLLADPRLKPRRPKQPPAPPGARRLADHRATHLCVVCEPCGLRKEFTTANLIATFGIDMPLPSLVRKLTLCTRAEGASRAWVCKAVYDFAAM